MNAVIVVPAGVGTEELMTRVASEEVDWGEAKVIPAGGLVL